MFSLECGEAPKEDCLLRICRFVGTNIHRNVISRHYVLVNLFRFRLFHL